MVFRARREFTSRCLFYDSPDARAETRKTSFPLYSRTDKKCGTVYAFCNYVKGQFFHHCNFKIRQPTLWKNLKNGFVQRTEELWKRPDWKAAWIRPLWWLMGHKFYCQLKLPVRDKRSGRWKRTSRCRRICFILKSCPGRRSATIQKMGSRIVMEIDYLVPVFFTDPMITSAARYGCEASTVSRCGKDRLFVW